MKKGLVVVGMALFAGGLIALFFGITAMVATPCFIDNDCLPNAGDNVMWFPIGLASIIIGSSMWSAGAGSLSGSRTPRNPLSFIGFFGIFGLSFFGIGAVMFLADQQPGADHTTNVLTVLGVIFGVVGIISMGVEVVSQRIGAADDRILATGIRGRATVLAVRDTNVTVNMNPMIALDLRVEIPGQPVFTRTVRQTISRLEVGSYRPGLVLAVAADPAMPGKFVVDWNNSPIGDATAGTDPVTGQPLSESSGAAPMPVRSGVRTAGAAGQPLSSGEVAGILRAAADQVAAGRPAAHPTVASAIGDSSQWSTSGGAMSSADVATLLRSIADRAAAGGLVPSGSTSTSVSGGGSMSSAQLAALLRQAADATAKAADGTSSSGATGS